MLWRYDEYAHDTGVVMIVLVTVSWIHR